MSRRAATFLMWSLLLGMASAPGVRATTGSSSTTALPFRPLAEARDRFAASNLTMPYEKDPTLFLSWKGARIDMDEIERHGHFPYGDVPLDPSEKSLVENSQPRPPAEMSPDEKEDLTPAEAGVHVGIPSAVAATGALLGGLAILVRILTLGI